ncbi:MAG: OadG family protein [Pseudomonadota bacterium]
MTDTLDQGLMLMALGMGTVFCFLGVLVLAVTFMSRLLSVDQTRETNTDATAAPSDAPTDTSDDPELISAIIAAVHRYRNNRS